MASSIWISHLPKDYDVAFISDKGVITYYKQKRFLCFKWLKEISQSHLL